MKQSFSHSSAYSEAGLWGKLKKVARSIGSSSLHEVLCLWLVIRDEAAPVWAKTVAVGALGYLISPVDAVPDVLPVVGLADDVGVIGAAIVTLSAYVTEDIRTRARGMLPHWM